MAEMKVIGIGNFRGGDPAAGIARQTRYPEG